MVIRNALLGIFLGTIYIFISSGCHKCNKQFFSFAIDTSYFYPQLDSVPLGDTIYFLSKTSTTLIDVNTGQKVDYSNSSNFGTSIGFSELTNLNQSADGVAAFQFIPDIGRIYTDSSVPSQGKAKQIEYAEKQREFIVSFAIVCLKKGIYVVSTGDQPAAIENCFSATIKMNVTNSDPHLHYLRDIYYGGGTIDPIDSTHSYCFKVY